MYPRAEFAMETTLETTGIPSATFLAYKRQSTNSLSITVDAPELPHVFFTVSKTIPAHA
jgi:hypothetical protein